MSMLSAVSFNITKYGNAVCCFKMAALQNKYYTTEKNYEKKI
jgi:hypothetical protein